MNVYVICLGFSILMAIVGIFLYLYEVDEKFTHETNQSNFNNCYSYAFSDYFANRKTKPQPGFKAGLPALNKDAYTCDAFIDRVKADYPDTIYLGADPRIAHTNCRTDMHLVFLALDNQGENRDYHFYRKDANGLWSHKPGILAVSTVDADNRLIANPFYANRRYAAYQYDTPCGFFCGPSQSVQ